LWGLQRVRVTFAAATHPFSLAGGDGGGRARPTPSPSLERVTSLLLIAIVTLCAVVVALSGAAPQAHAGSPSPAPPSASVAPAPSQPTASVSPAPSPRASATGSPPAGPGADLFAGNCSGCHGAMGEGGFGPPLKPAGFSSLVFTMVEDGGIAMPSFGGALDEQQIQLVADYVAQYIADPATHTADVAEGGQIFRLYCSGCHGSTGRGGALTMGGNAPPLTRYPPAEALAAMYYGRRNMPAFADGALDLRQQAAVALYVQLLAEPPSPGGAGLGYVGPVPEGIVAGGALLILILLAVWLAWKQRERRVA
jgi:ubiquinol-cytochrome c reductase cytochrome c subunit